MDEPWTYYARDKEPLIMNHFYEVSVISKPTDRKEISGYQGLDKGEYLLNGYSSLRGDEKLLELDSDCDCTAH